jgi:glycosyltransferase involved in cell wall biosynthesis
MKFAFIAEHLPPATQWAGQTSVTRRLLEPLDPASYCLVSRVDYNAEPYACAPNRLPARYHHVAEPFARRAVESRADVLRGWTTSLANAAAAVWGTAAAVRREGCDAIVASTDTVPDLPIGYAVSRTLGIPYYAYLFDDYLTKWHHYTRSMRVAAQGLEPALMRGAAGVIVVNDHLRDELERRYGVRATVIRNSVDLGPYEQVGESRPAFAGEEIRLIFTGAVYWAHYDAMRNLVAALASLPAVNARLHAYTPSSPQELIEEGLAGPVVVHSQQPAAAMPRLQREAHILFLPLAFERPSSDFVRTAAPAKMGEFLAARRPILVHAPPDSFVSSYFREHECGLVVDEPDPAKLAAAIERLATDADLRERLADRAWERAQADYDLAGARATFRQVLGLGH